MGWPSTNHLQVPAARCLQIQIQNDGAFPSCLSRSCFKIFNLWMLNFYARNIVDAGKGFRLAIIVVTPAMIEKTNLVDWETSFS